MKTMMFIFGVSVLLVLSHTVLATPADALTPVPEPLSFATVGVALASLAGYKIYKKRQ
jgi:hypothetical protein